MEGITNNVTKHERDNFASFLIEHYECSKDVRLLALIYNFGARFKNKKALDYFRNIKVRS